MKNVNAWFGSSLPLHLKNTADELVYQVDLLESFETLIFSWDRTRLSHLASFDGFSMRLHIQQMNGVFNW